MPTPSPSFTPAITSITLLWIGLLYFFNLVQVQSMPKMVEAGAAKPYTQIILPKALFLFRHAALWTVITGIAYYIAGRGVVQGIPSGEIMIGMLLGIIMAGNVWFIIWHLLRGRHGINCFQSDILVYRPAKLAVRKTLNNKYKNEKFLSNANGVFSNKIKSC